MYKKKKKVITSCSADKRTAHCNVLLCGYGIELAVSPLFLLLISNKTYYQ